MTEAFVTTDIIVIVVLIVVLACIGACAFLTHFYWTSIGVAEVWNTTKWSSIRSSIFRTMGRFSRASSKYSSGRPLSGFSNYNEEGISNFPPSSNEHPSSAVILQQKQPKQQETKVQKQSQSSPSLQKSPGKVKEQKNAVWSSNFKRPQQHTSDVTNTRRSSRGINQVQPVSTITYNNSSSGNTATYKQKSSSQYATKIGQPLTNTKIHNIYEHNNAYNEDDKCEVNTEYL
ncbi:unnamed protein product [Didymodactylos carnosus]|uniref:Uncharacterized protein n=1 Tax=Didymodactylos carnosus TaxID=1234261 RepID=A0A813WKG6_9BILA|nr:unnamed protein product [Didymodactylos carnosus]CAF3650359.1 unnamed protein product [Didymodactylos carnosus]